MKCQENNCEYYKNDCWCEIFDEYTKCMNCYGAFKPMIEKQYNTLKGDVE